MLGKEVPIPASTLTLFHSVIKILNCSRWGLKMKHVFFRDYTGVTKPGSKALHNETGNESLGGKSIDMRMQEEHMQLATAIANSRCSI